MHEVAILNPGPSLARLTAEALGRPQAIIAVNTAMDHPLAAGADWWCAHDLWSPPKHILPRQAPRRGMVTSDAAISEGQRTWVPWPLYDFRCALIAEPVRNTTSAAIYWAADLIRKAGGIGRIRLHGCDLRGTAYYDRTTNPAETPEEWRLVRADIDKAVAAVPVPVLGLPA